MPAADRRVLVAEDNPALARVVGFTLKRAGYVPSVFRDGADAWDAAQAGAFDLVVSDQQMPRMTGLELIERLRADARHADTPIVLLTAKGMELDAAKLRDELNVGAVLIKPFSPVELTRLVGQLDGQPTA